MSLASQINALATRTAAEIKAVKATVNKIVYSGAEPAGTQLGFVWWDSGSERLKVSNGAGGWAITDHNNRVWVGAAAPTVAGTDSLHGVLWYDTTALCMKVYDANYPGWRQDADAVPLQSGAPAAPIAGQLWYDTTASALGYNPAAIGLRGTATLNMATSGTWYQLLFGGTDHTSGTGDFTVAGSVITVLRAGVYRVSANASFDNSTVGRRIVHIESFTTQAVGSGVDIVRAEQSGAYTTATAWPTLNAYTEVYLSAGTKLRVNVYHTAGAALLITNNPVSQFNVSLIYAS